MLSSSLLHIAQTNPTALTPGDVLVLQRSVGNHYVQRLLAPHRPPPPVQPLRDRAPLLQREWMDPPQEMAGLKLKDLTKVVKLFGEGSKTYLVEFKNQPYVLKLSSDNAVAEVKTGLFAKELGIRTPGVSVLEYTKGEVEQLDNSLSEDPSVTKGMKKKMFRNLEEREGNQQAVLMEFVPGKSLSSRFGFNDLQQMPIGGTTDLKDKLMQQGKLDSFFIDLGKVAAFDILVGHTDRFPLEGYRGGRDTGNLGNAMITDSNELSAIDMDLGDSSLDEDSLGSMRNVHQKHLPQLLEGNFQEIIAKVLLAFSETEDENAPLSGDLATYPQAPQLIGAGIQQVLNKVKFLQPKDLQDTLKAWTPTSVPYGNFVVKAMQKIRGEEAPTKPMQTLTKTITSLSIGNTLTTPTSTAKPMWGTKFQLGGSRSTRPTTSFSMGSQQPKNTGEQNKETKSEQLESKNVGSKNILGEDESDDL